MNRHWKMLPAVGMCVLLATAAALAEEPYEMAWKRQIGTSDGDLSYAVAVDASGDVYISGLTNGDLGGPNAGHYDAFLSKFDASGNEVWTTQIGASVEQVRWPSPVHKGSGPAWRTPEDDVHNDFAGQQLISYL